MVRLTNPNPGTDTTVSTRIYMRIAGRIGNTGGYSGVFVLMLCFLFIAVLGLMLEFYRDYTVKQTIEREMQRSVNIAVDLSMMDEYRQDGVSRLDAERAREVFYSYLHDVLLLDAGLVYRKDGMEYGIVLQDVVITSEPPMFEVRALVEINPLFFGDIVRQKIRIPVKAKARNKRIV